MRAAVGIADPAALIADLHALLPERLDLDVYGMRIAVAATSPEALRRLRMVYGSFAGSGGGDPDARLALVEKGHRAHARLARVLRPEDPLAAADGHILVADWLDVALSLRDETLLHYYASKLIRLHLVACQEPEFLTLHAASVASGRGRGFLLVGEAASGKTTLTLRLLDQGFRFCSDDTTVIRRSDGRCVPFPLAFILRGGPEGQPPDLPGVRDRDPDLQLLDEPRWLLPRGGEAGSDFDVDTIFFLHGMTDRPPGVAEALSAGEAAMELLRNVVVPLGRTNPSAERLAADFHLACDLAGGARCLSVNSTDLSRTLECVCAHAAAVPA
ncbi:MAG: hypothetical protein Tsb0019_22950 [Roseibium sp.]